MSVPVENQTAYVFDKVIDSIPNFKSSQLYLDMMHQYDREDIPERLYYCDFGYVADYVIQQLQEGKNDEVKIVIKMTEKFFDAKLSDDAENFLIIGILETLQNNLLNKNMDLKTIGKLIVSKKALHYWKAIINFWQKGRLIEHYED